MASRAERRRSSVGGVDLVNDATQKKSIGKGTLATDEIEAREAVENGQTTATRTDTDGGNFGRN